MRRFSLIFKSFGVIFLIYQVLRLCFLFFNWDVYASFALNQISLGWWHGLRFDLYAVLWLSFPLILIWLFTPSSILKKSKFLTTTRWLFFLLHSFAIGFNVADWEFFKFSGKRMTFDVFFIADEIGATGLEMMKYYFLESSIGIVLFVILFLNLKSIFKREHIDRPDVPTSYFLSLALGALTIICCFLGMRGGVQLKPIRPVDAYQGVAPQIAVLSLNTTFTIIRSKNSGKLKKFKFFSTTDEINEVLKQKQYKPSHWGDFKGFNVVVILLESFSIEFTGLNDPDLPSYTPFLKSLVKSSKVRVFKRHFANGRRSIDAVPSILSSIPSLMSQSFVTSNFQTNRLVSWGEELQKTGYKTAFFHGAKNGSMYFDSFSAQAGFQNYFGLSEYPDPKDSDGTWGIFDEPFFNFAQEQLSKIGEPFGAVLFSLSSHHPYSIPIKYFNRFPKGTADIHESIGYTDYALKMFFDRAKIQPWFEKTVFIITADHTSKVENQKYKSLQGGHHVPLLIYSPSSISLPAVAKGKITQHIDIPKTIFNLLGMSPKASILFGHDIFDTQFLGEAFNFSYPGYWYLDSKGLFKFTAEGTLQNKSNSASGWNQSSTLRAHENRVERRFQGWLQYYRNGLIENSWAQQN